jgi:hypothetical protein
MDRDLALDRIVVQQRLKTGDVPPVAVPLKFVDRSIDLVAIVLNHAAVLLA